MLSIFSFRKAWSIGYDFWLALMYLLRERSSETMSASASRSQRLLCTLVGHTCLDLKISIFRVYADGLLPIIPWPTLLQGLGGSTASADPRKSFSHVLARNFRSWTLHYFFIKGRLVKKPPSYGQMAMLSMSYPSCHPTASPVNPHHSSSWEVRQ